MVLLLLFIPLHVVPGKQTEERRFNKKLWCKRIPLNISVAIVIDGYSICCSLKID